jgi:hypothetical protein
MDRGGIAAVTMIHPPPRPDLASIHSEKSRSNFVFESPAVRYSAYGRVLGCATPLAGDQERCFRAVRTPVLALRPLR